MSVKSDEAGGQGAAIEAVLMFRAERVEKSGVEADIMATNFHVRKWLIII